MIEEVGDRRADRSEKGELGEVSEYVAGGAPTKRVRGGFARTISGEASEGVRDVVREEHEPKGDVVRGAVAGAAEADEALSSRVGGEL